MKILPLAYFLVPWDEEVKQTSDLEKGDFHALH